MLKAITQLLEKHGRLSLRELSNYFDMAPDALEPMLHLLKRKNRITIDENSCGSATCSGCSCVSRSDMISASLTSPLDAAQHVVN